MKTVRVPKFLHELFGKKSTFVEVSLTLTFALLSTLLILIGTYAEWRGFQVYQIIILFILAIDINGGVIANFTFSTNNQYKQSAKARIIFIAIHVQPLILAIVLQEYFYIQ
ncbi:hypothetical protein [Amphibacillus sediminis]|uniref:hypothetical protein n=1 Tax=Amphibacillus sediminis TaxID=360185 RepID=UPI001C3F296C|nr:hypothetical protein [Amphibacillus sediminis]